MSKARRGEIWSVGGNVPRMVLIVSGNMFNDLGDHPFVLAMTVQPGVVERSIFTVQVTGDKFVLVDTIGQIPKVLLTERLHELVEVQVLTDVNNNLFKILATS